jgi:hypothetical protein
MDSNIVNIKFESYPEDAKIYAKSIRSLIYDVAKDEGISHIDGALKWGEPSFKAPNGSPIRMDWKSKTPDNFYIFFNCKSILIETFRVVYNSELTFEGSRAIILKLKDKVPEDILKHCFSMAL